MEYKKPNLFFYRVTQIASWFWAKLVFKRKFKRNEIKGKKGPFVVIANHQAAFDFANLIGATKERMSFVVSNSFYNSLPVKGVMDKIGVLPKQQFQTTLKDIGRMKAVLENGAPLVIYPAGLMSEDGLSTPIPCSTYKFLKWLGVDVYAAKTSGTYFCTPKWSKKRRRGRTYVDIYKLFSKEELHELDETVIKERTDEALLFDAYREQEDNLVRYKDGDNIEGLENVLYKCPECGAEFSVSVKDKNTICCSVCGFAHKSDKYGFLHNVGKTANVFRYVSDWSRKIYESLKKDIENGLFSSIFTRAKISTIDGEKKKFVEIGEADIVLTEEKFDINGNLGGEVCELSVPIHNFASLPFSPGKYFEIQHGENILRCTPEDPKIVMKLINAVKIFYELNLSRVGCRDVHRAEA